MLNPEDLSYNQARVIGHQIRVARRDRKLALEALADATRIDAARLADIETGQARATTQELRTILGALGVSTADFFQAIDKLTGAAALDPDQAMLAKCFDLLSRLRVTGQLAAALAALRKLEASAQSPDSSGH